MAKSQKTYVKTFDWITHLSTTMYLKADQNIHFSLRDKKEAKSFNKSWLDIRVYKDGVATGIGITVSSTEVTWLSHNTFEATEADFSEPMTTSEYFGKRTLTYEHCTKNNYEYIKISVQKDSNAKICRLCIPRKDLEEFLNHLRSYRCLFKYSNFYDSAKMLWEKKIILIMVSAASTHPCFTLDSPPPGIDTILNTITSSNILLPRFIKALQFLGFSNASELKLDEIKFNDGELELAKAFRAQDSTMGATKNELILTRHSIFLFKHVTSEFSEI